MTLLGLALAAGLCSGRPFSENVLADIYREHFPHGRILEDGVQDTIDELEKENPPQNSSERRVLDDLENMGQFEKYLKRHEQFLTGEALRYKDLHQRAESELTVSLQRKENDIKSLEKHLGSLRTQQAAPSPHP